jgi:hypothetical protein
VPWMSPLLIEPKTITIQPGKCDSEAHQKCPIMA